MFEIAYIMMNYLNINYQHTLPETHYRNHQPPGTEGNDQKYK